MTADTPPSKAAAVSPKPDDLPQDHEDFARLLGRLVASRWLAARRIATSTVLPDDEVPAETEAISHPDPAGHDAI